MTDGYPTCATSKSKRVAVFTYSTLLLSHCGIFTSAFQVNPKLYHNHVPVLYSTLSDEQKEEAITSGRATATAAIAANEEHDNDRGQHDVSTSSHVHSYSSSKALESILARNDMTTNDFFEQVWQRQPMLFKSDNDDINDGVCSGESWNGEAATATRTIHTTSTTHKSPPILDQLVTEGWQVMIDLLERAAMPHDGPEQALILKNRNVQNRQECVRAYGPSLFGPYLDGCSVVQNHADLLSPWIAALCQDLQGSGSSPCSLSSSSVPAPSFPHVYANTYLTPPMSQAMRPHADDRDVFVIQLVGAKEWRVCSNVPIEFPFSHQQVGKNGLDVPSHVLQGDNDKNASASTSVSSTLHAGDVLYIPRGHVHQAFCGGAGENTTTTTTTTATEQLCCNDKHKSALSFHVTIAIPTFDWTLAGMMNTATNSLLLPQRDCRKSILPLSTAYTREDLQDEIDNAIQLLHEHVTADAILDNLQARIDAHVQRATPIRMRLMDEQQQANCGKASKRVTDKVDNGASGQRGIDLDTYVRVPVRTTASRMTSTNGSSNATNTTWRHSCRTPPQLFLREELKGGVETMLSNLWSSGCSCRVADLRSLMLGNITSTCRNVENGHTDPATATATAEIDLVRCCCDLTLICLAKRLVELGALEVVTK